LEEEYGDNGGFRPGPVYSNNLAVLIRRKSSDAKLIQEVDDIAGIEKKVRNVAAHEIVSVTDEWFKKNAGKSAKEIFSIIRFLIAKAGINVKDEQWQSYDKMNEMIINLLA
jgi:hypothetical protein